VHWALVKGRLAGGLHAPGHDYYDAGQAGKAAPYRLRGSQQAAARGSNGACARCRQVNANVGGVRSEANITDVHEALHFDSLDEGARPGPWRPGLVALLQYLWIQMPGCQGLQKNDVFDSATHG